MPRLILDEILAEYKRQVIYSICLGVVICLSVGLGLYYYLPNHSTGSSTSESFSTSVFTNITSVITVAIASSDSALSASTSSTTTTCGSQSALTQTATGETQTIPVNAQDSAPYDVLIWTNNALSNATVISNSFILNNLCSPPTIISFYVNSPSFIFASPSSFQVNPESNGTTFTFAYTNGTSVPQQVYSQENAIGTEQPVSGWLAIQTWPG